MNFENSKTSEFYRLLINLNKLLKKLLAEKDNCLISLFL